MSMPRTVVAALLSLLLTAVFWWAAVWTYYEVADRFGDSSPLIYFQISTYAILVSTVAIAATSSFTIGRFLRADIALVALVTMLVIGLAAYPVLFTVSYLNVCALGEAFPLAATCH